MGKKGVFIHGMQTMGHILERKCFYKEVKNEGGKQKQLRNYLAWCGAGASAQPHSIKNNISSVAPKY